MAPKRIPIAAAKRFGEEFGYDQVIVIARDHESGRQHVTTWGASKQLCASAGQVAATIKGEVLGWPQDAI